MNAISFRGKNLVIPSINSLRTDFLLIIIKVCIILLTTQTSKQLNTHIKTDFNKLHSIQPLVRTVKKVSN